jgi:hypothetical protein
LSARFREAVRNEYVRNFPVQAPFASSTAHSGGEPQIPVQGFAWLAHVSGHKGVRAHALNVCRDAGSGTIAVNGIVRREVVCVLDEHGRGQVFDLSQDEEEMEEGYVDE